MRRNVAIGAALLLLLALVVWWRFLRGGNDASGTTTAGSGSSAIAKGAGAQGGTKTPSAKVRLSGRVTRKADGTGVAGAIVTLDPKRTIATFLGGAGRGGDAEEPPLAIADKDGRWSLDNIESGKYTLGATGTGLLPSSRDLVVATTSMDGLDFALDKGGAIASGTVSDVLGGPIPGAKIRAKRARNNPLDTDADIVAFTDDKGQYALALPPGSFMFAASHEAYTPGAHYLEMTADPVTVDFTLTPGATIRGQVVTTDGTPVPDASVVASGSAMRFNLAAFGGGDTTDEKGNFTLKSLSPGALSLSATGGGYTTASPTVVEVGIGEQVDGVRIVVEKGFSISGHVVEKGTTKGIPGVRVGVFSIGTGDNGFSRQPSTEDGSFIIEGVRPASFLMFAIGDEVMPEVGQTVEVVDKDVKDVKVEMASGVTITGRVDPPAVANVSISPTMVGLANMFEAAKSIMVRGESDATGAFTLHHAPAGSFKLTAETQDGRAGEVTIVVEKVDKRDVVVKLEPRASIAGKVIDSTGAIVNDVEVRARSMGDKDKGGFQMRFDRGDNGGSSRTRQDGSFEIVGLDAGKYGLSVTDSRGKIAWASPANKDKPTAPIEMEVKDAPVKNVTLSVETRDGSIKGNVVMPDGKPAADTWITISMERGKPKSSGDPKKDAREDFDPDEMRARYTGGYAPVITNSEGRFSIEKLRKGSYKVIGENAKGSARGQKEGVKTGETITLQLGRLGTLTGKVTVNGEPAFPYDIDCDPVGSRTGMSSHGKRVTEKTGVYLLERLPPGEYECDVTADSGQTTAKVTVPAGDATLDIALVPWASITGTVVSVLSGEPVAGVKLMASAPGSMDRSAITDLLGGKGPTSDAKGAFTISRVAPGKGTLVVMPASGGFQQLAKQEYEAKAGQKLDLGAIKIVPPRNGDAGTLGLGTDTEDDKLTVADVRDGGPAQAAGIAVGDRITSINGLDVATLTPAVAQSLIGSGNMSVGQKFVLGIERAGAAQQVTVVSVKW